MDFPKHSTSLFVYNLPNILYQNDKNCICYPIISNGKKERWLCEYKKGFKLKPHKHNGIYEIFVIEGKVKYFNDNKVHILEKDYYYYNPINEVHSLETLEDSKILWILN